MTDQPILPLARPSQPSDRPSVNNSASAGRSESTAATAPAPGSLKARHARARQRARALLSSRTKHLVVLALVVVDVAGILADIFVGLITCELGRQHEAWVGRTRHALTNLSLALSCLFLLELGLEIWAHGLRYFTSFTHCFDALVIIGSFAVDMVEHGDAAEEVASLIVILRLWRFVKVANGIHLEATEQRAEYKKRVDELELENATLRRELGPPYLDQEPPYRDEEPRRHGELL